MTKLKILAVAFATGLVLAPHAQAEDIVRHGIPGSTFPISRAVEVPAGKTTVYLSGVVPSIIDEAADRNTVAAYGNTKMQTESVLKTIEGTLNDLGLAMKDVIKMQAFLVGDTTKGGQLDFAGFMEGYVQFFGTDKQPNLPSRSVVQVAALASPGFLVEIEVTAVRP